MNILFLGGAKRVSMARHFIDAGASRGLDVKIFSYELDTAAPIACVATVVKGLRWRDPGLVADLERVVKLHDISLMVPFVDQAVEVAASFTATHPGVWSPTAPASEGRVMFDKVAAAKLFESLAIPVPATYTPSAVSYPAIAKPRHGSASKGITLLREKADLDRLANPDDYLIQEYVADAEEYTVDCYVDRQGRALCAVPRRRLEVAGGEVTRTVTVDIPRLNAIAASVLSLTALTGAVTLQFLHSTADDRWLLMEINPRLGGGAVTAIHAGAHIPSLIIAEALGETPGPASWRPGVEIARYMQEVVFTR